MGATESKEVQGRLQGATLEKAAFPVDFSLYYHTIKGGLKLAIGEHKDQPCNIMSLPSGWYGEMILYSGATPQAAPLAVVRDAGKLTQYDKIDLAPLRSGQEVLQEDMKYFSRGWNIGYKFASPVGDGVQKEDFEWRYSKGDDVKELGERSRGWELVRLSNKDEVLAVWSEVSRTKLAWSKTASFRFVGPGATGAMGAAWSVMAVTTFLRIWQRRARTTVGAGIGAGAASGAIAGA